MEPVRNCSCWPVARRTLVVFALVALGVYLMGGVDATVVASH